MSLPENIASAREGNLCTADWRLIHKQKLWVLASGIPGPDVEAFTSRLDFALKERRRILSVMAPEE